MFPSQQFECTIYDLWLSIDGWHISRKKICIITMIQRWASDCIESVKLTRKELNGETAVCEWCRCCDNNSFLENEFFWWNLWLLSSVCCFALYSIQKPCSPFVIVSPFVISYRFHWYSFNCMLVVRLCFQCDHVFAFAFINFVDNLKKKNVTALVLFWFCFVFI